MERRISIFSGELSFYTLTKWHGYYIRHYILEQPPKCQESTYYAFKFGLVMHYIINISAVHSTH